MTLRESEAVDQQSQAVPEETSKEFHLRQLVNQLSEEICNPCPKTPTAPILNGLTRLEQAIIRYHHDFGQASGEELTLSYASEWVLDNFYIIHQSIDQIREDLPAGYLERLPKLNRSPWLGYPRIFAVVQAWLISEQLQVNSIYLENFLTLLQEKLPLTMGELWAVPIFLRFTLLEALVYALDQLVKAEKPTTLVTPQHDFNLNYEDAVASAVTSLRTISNIDWRTFFEAVSQVDRILAQDPSGTYEKMDFPSRNLYRSAIEELSHASGVGENEIAISAVYLAQEFANRKPGAAASLLEDDLRGAHVGYYLIEEGRQKLENEIGYRPAFLVRVRRWAKSHVPFFYLSSIFILTLLLLILLSLPLASQQSMLWKFIVTWLVLLIPVTQIASGIINWLATLFFKPSILPKLEFEEAIPPEYQTLIAIPALLTSHAEADSLVEQLELHYLRNSNPGISFALVSDFSDADQEILPDDVDCVNYAEKLIEKLNQKYPAADGRSLFYLLHRKRLWNPGEEKWMGWERKRGKLHELNRLLRDETDTSFQTIVGDISTLRTVRYVITLDADTILPMGSASRLIGTIAHPLNHAIFAPNSREIIAGYTILQPRVEINPVSANHSWFSRIYSGDIGLDLYSRAVSDVYQDLFSEGIYVGKGIYDVDGFERSIAGRIPENTLLSHDLLEGIFGRVGLVTDITLVENYPSSYFVYANRQKRWIRGDWQLLPWLLTPKERESNFTPIDRWKIVDNLRRSLLFPSLLLLFSVAWIFFPGQAPLWTVIGLLSLFMPVLTSLVSGTIRVIADHSVSSAIRPLRMDFIRWVLAVTFLPFETLNSINAIRNTLYRLYISKRHLLKWTSSALVERKFSLDSLRTIAWREMRFAILFVIALAILIIVLDPVSIWVALPLLLAWILAPLVALLINQPITKKKVPLTEKQVQQLRSYARRTWSFFETFVGPEDHWLPPDHYQESPVGMVAHRTSPTNIGLLLTSTIAAYEFGYIDQFSLASRLSATFETLETLYRYRGHFLNWIDTLTLQPLNPRYISTVDSGNLAACLIFTAESMNALTSEIRVFRWQRWQGYLDTLDQLDTILAPLEHTQVGTTVREIRQMIANIQQEVKAAHSHPATWYSLFLKVSGPAWENMAQRLSILVSSGEEAIDIQVLRRIRQVAQQADQHLKGTLRTIQELVPWIPLFEDTPSLLKTPLFADSYAELRSSLPYSPFLGQIGQHVKEGHRWVGELKEKLGDLDQNGEQAKEVSEWLEKLSEQLNRAASNVSVLLSGYSRITSLALRFVEEMDFRFLYDPNRKVFHIGLNLDTSILDNNYYDLLASEARLTSLIAIAKEDVPSEHWLHLSRPVTRVKDHLALLSWSATMFEYLMPSLFISASDGTLLEDSDEGAVLRQMEYGKEKNTPWGISESGFYAFDANQNYQYRAFGVPGLGFKRGLGDDLVVAPYASLMAVGFKPLDVLRNAEKLIDLGMLGLYGFYEAIDFTESRMAYSQKYGIVRSYMAHHHGMTLLAMLNYLDNDFVIQRMQAHSKIRSIELLVQEQIPYAAPLQNPESENVKGTQRLVTPPVVIEPWSVPTQTSIPQVHLLSNGSFNSVISNSGSGFLHWQDFDLTRWQPDTAFDSKGIWIYIKEQEPNRPDLRIGSITGHPIPDHQDEQTQVTYHSHMAVFRRNLGGIASTLEVTVPPDDPVEIRRLHLSNLSDRERKLTLTSYGEVILTSLANDARHPAFNKLFIQSEYLSDLNLLIFRRRPRSSTEKPIYLGHMLLKPESLVSDSMYETDRARFLGRWKDVHRPDYLLQRDYETGSTGSTLDPIFSIGQELVLPAHENIRLTWLTFAASSQEEILALAHRYRSWSMVDRSYQQAHAASEHWLRRSDIGSETLRQFLQILSALLYPNPAYRAPADTIRANQLGQPGLWPFGISGDYPILLVQISNTAKLELVREALQAHRFFRDRGILVDLVILNEQQTNYGAEMNRLLYRLIARAKSDNWLSQRGGIFVLYADQMKEEERILLLTTARVVLKDENGTIRDQNPGFAVPVRHLPGFIPTLPSPIHKASAQEPAEDLLFWNGYGGFSKDGREYVIYIEPGKQPPLPWSNVIGYPEFGFLLTESGSSTTWRINSGENRLTPWSNDPISDPTGEALYLRDEETGEIWTPTPKPAGEDGYFSVRHGAGYSQFDHHSHDLEQHLVMFADPSDPVKIIRLRMKNTSDRPRRLTTTQYVEWVLGTLRSITSAYLIPEYVPEHEALLARNPYNTEFNQATAFLAASKKIHGMTADRLEFLGRNGSMERPIGLQRIGLEGRVEAGDHPCAVLQLHIDLPAYGEEEIYFVLGEAEDRQQALNLIEKYHDPGQVVQSFEAVKSFWDEHLGSVEISTPDPAIDLMLNRWFLYQTLSCRIWGRTAFYQSSGAFGFRDQLQDVMATLMIQPEIARDQIRKASRHQFEEGDVLHWWHPPTGRGVRTRISDDLLWLPYVVAQYVEVTGDTSILDDEEPFLQGQPLREDEEERYGYYSQSEQKSSILEHCRRAIKKGSTRGPHGLPLIGTGDWNDGMNRVGIEGRGESVWLAWFLFDTLQRFAWLCEISGYGEEAQRCQQQAAELKTAIYAAAWDGEWYLRAYYDSGAPLGSRKNQECRIDSIAQSWSVLSRAGEPERVRQAMQSILNQLVYPDNRLLLLFTPPFDKTPRDPGYIKAYVPGIRENGGQYTHAATWTAWAFSMLGEGNRAGDLYQLLNPVYQSTRTEEADQYKVEPYVVAADIYSTPPHVRRGGWTWYTGSSGWMYRLGLEAILGLRKKGDTMQIQPVIPAAWEQYSIRYRHKSSTYAIHVANPEHKETGIRSMTLDGVEQPQFQIHLQDDGKTHLVEVVMG